MIWSYDDDDDDDDDDEDSADGVEVAEFPIDEEGHRILRAEQPDEYAFWLEHGIERWRWDDRDGEESDDTADTEEYEDEQEDEQEDERRQIDHIFYRIQNENINEYVNRNADENKYELILPG